MDVINQVVPTAEALQSFFGEGEDGAFVMVNLLKFRDRAEYEDGDRGLSGAEAYALYGSEVVGLVEKHGGRSIYAGAVTGLLLGEVEENWDMVALVEYPSLEEFRAMMMSPEYQAIAVHRSAGLKGQLNIRTKQSRS